MTRPKSLIAVERVDPADRSDRLDGVYQGHPTESVRRAESSLSSRHSRLADHLLVPEEDFDADRAAELCAEVCRLALEELVPGLILIEPANRVRIQAQGAYLLALFDFAGQPGMEGERLAQINRWEYNLELALEEDPVGQPIFVHLANCYAQNPWPDAQFSRFGVLARHRAASEQGLRGTALDRWFERIGGAIREQFLGRDTPVDLDSVISAIARTQRLKSRVLLQLRSRQTTKSQNLRSEFESGVAVTSDEIDSLLGELNAGSQLIKLIPKQHRKPTRYAVKASIALLSQCKKALLQPTGKTLQLGIFSRLYLLLGSSLRS